MPARKTAPPQPQEAQAATLSQPAPKPAPGPIVARSRRLPDSLKNFTNRFHDINIRQEGELFALWNGEAPCGDRLVKGELFPYPDECAGDIWHFDKIEQAQEYADRLQRFLDFHENGDQLKAELKRHEKEMAQLAKEITF